jgi:hypothetical protein
MVGLEIRGAVEIFGAAEIFALAELFRNRNWFWSADFPNEQVRSGFFRLGRATGVTFGKYEGQKESILWI